MNNGTGFLPLRNTGASSSATRLTGEYELSDDLSRRQLECLEKKYGDINKQVHYAPNSSQLDQGQANVSSPRKNSTPCMEPKSTARSFNDAILSPRLSQRHGFVSPIAQSTPNRVSGTSPVIWVQNNRQSHITPIGLNSQSAKNATQFNESDPPSSPSLTPSDSTSMSPSHPRMNCQNSTSSNSLESQNLVQIDRQVFKSFFLFKSVFFYL
ncbi:hypothetical protein M3Y97_00719800 [Aphelenchoides bicaudatus]|nr:hypothetical protein M3Y97_00719800 [Aphelenchoides bicaudatus]